MTTTQRHSDDALSALLAELGPGVFFAACNSPEMVVAQSRYDVALASGDCKIRPEPDRDAVGRWLVGAHARHWRQYLGWR